MTLEELIKELNKMVSQYPEARVTYNIEAGKGKSVLIWSVYPEVYDSHPDEMYIVVSNKV